MQYNFDEIIDRTNTGSVKYDYTEKVFGTNDVLPMWVADMDFKTPDFVVEAVKKRAEHEIYGYPVKPDSFYNSVKKWLAERHDWDISTEWLSFSPGVVPGIATSVLAVTQPGDKIIIQSPVYFPFYEVVEGTGREYVVNELKLDNGKYYIDFPALEEAITPDVKAILFCSPHNPVGRVWTEEELKELGRITKKYDITIISDDIHADFIYPPNKHIPIASINDDLAERTITTITPSKTFNIAGLSTSVVVIPNMEKRNAYNEQLKTLHLGMGNIFGIAALEAAYTNGAPWLDELMHYLSGNLEWMNQYFESNLPELKIIQPEATYLAWIDFSALGLGDEELKQFVTNEAKIALNPGIMFGKGGEGFMRLNFACPREILKKGVYRLENAVREKRK